MSIFLLLVASIGYFMYRWYEVVQEVNIINSRTIEGVSEDKVNLTALASIHQTCVANLEISQNNPSNPICNSSFGLTCVTGMYLGNGDGTNTGVCLSNIGSYCDTIYDCVPSAPQPDDPGSQSHAPNCQPRDPHSKTLDTAVTSSDRARLSMIQCSRAHRACRPCRESQLAILLLVLHQPGTSPSFWPGSHEHA